MTLPSLLLPLASCRFPLTAYRFPLPASCLPLQPYLEKESQKKIAKIIKQF